MPLPKPNKESLLFFSLLAAEIILLFWSIANRFIPAGHDGFQYFSLFYYFLNNAVISNEVANWLPFMTQGTVATWWYTMQATLLQNTIFLFPELVKDMNCIPIFHVSVFIDKLLLVIGTWLLSRRLFESVYTAFFVSLTMSASCVWMTQLWYSLHLYYAIPLILYFFHRFLDTQKWRYLFLCANLFIIQNLGNLPYFIPISSLAVFLYMFFFVAFNYRDVRGQCAGLKFNLIPVFVITSIGLSFWALHYVMTAGTDYVFTDYIGRNPDGSSSLENFLTYAKNMDMSKWMELFFRMSPAFDITLYMGILLTPFLFIGLFLNNQRRLCHIHATALTLLLFSMGTFISSFFYYTWPFMKFYRHLSLISPMVKLFVCFIAAVGFEEIFIHKRHLQKIKAVQIPYLLIIALFAGLVIGQTYLVSHPREAKVVTDKIIDSISWMGALPEHHYLSKERQARIAFALVYAALTFIFLILFRRAKSEKTYAWLLSAVLILHAFDLYTYTVAETKRRSLRVESQAEYTALRFTQMPFSMRRITTIYKTDPRTELASKLIGSKYWSINSFLFKDQAGSNYRTDHWLHSLDEYMRAQWGQPIDQKRQFLKGQRHFFQLVFPTGHPASNKIAGLSANKIQFFSDSAFVADDKEIAKALVDRNYTGGFLLLSQSTEPEASLYTFGAGRSIQTIGDNTEITPPFRIDQFDSNNFKITVDLQKVKRAWMLYSDAWHPLWKATINGKKVPVFKANLGYKAVPLKEGLNEVSLTFNPEWLALLHKLIQINSLFWIFFLLYYAGVIGRINLFARTTTLSPPQTK